MSALAARAARLRHQTQRMETPAPLAGPRRFLAGQRFWLRVVALAAVAVPPALAQAAAAGRHPTEKAAQAALNTPPTEATAPLEMAALGAEAVYELEVALEVPGF